MPALAEDCHPVRVHNDRDDRAETKTVRALLEGRGLATPVIPLVPVRGSDPSRLPRHPRDVERPRGGRRSGADHFDYIGQNVSLDALARIPAYADRVAETEEALKGLGYL
ncbi:hypothetical protein [Actinomadura sp. NEAU-AAG7]|uniref:hypothetical protein n=1 Tax=Actinomadura sp. NEAU-AAG7 TaxID=2839640 RepID=UPI001BE44169|nr:hypothetical protein [Actinomadura sp. NEAU-AAG7]MBT2213614.1 hypothetical protein [Actinomadura sp. NEAU-AAG7]